MKNDKQENETIQEFIQRKKKEQQSYQEKQEKARAKTTQEKLNKFHGGFGKRVKPLSKEELERIQKSGSDEEKQKAFFDDGTLRNWIECDFETTKINLNKPTILAFGGNGALESRDANFTSKFVEGLVGTAEENGFDLFSFYYDRTQEKIVIGKTVGWFSNKTHEKIFNSFVLPLLKDENGNFFDEKTISKNLGKLKLFGFCFGADESNVILKNLRKELEKKFSPKKAENLSKKVFAVYVAPLAKEKYKNGTIVEFFSAKDKNFEKELQQDKKSELENFRGVAFLKESINKNGIDVVSDTFINPESTRDEHSIGIFMKKFGVVDRLELPGTPEEKTRVINQKKENPDRLQERPKGYSRQQAISDMISSVLSYGLLTDSPQKEDLETILRALINKENKNFFEQEISGKKDQDAKDRKQKEKQEKERQRQDEQKIDDFFNDTQGPLNPHEFFEKARKSQALAQKIKKKDDRHLGN